MSDLIVVPLGIAVFLLVKYLLDKVEEVSNCEDNTGLHPFGSEESPHDKPRK